MVIFFGYIELHWVLDYMLFIVIISLHSTVLTQGHDADIFKYIMILLLANMLSDITGRHYFGEVFD